MIPPGFDTLIDFGRSFLGGDVAKMTFAFLIAARLHRQWVRKDITEQMLTLTSAITSLGDTVKDGLALHSKKIDELTVRVDTLEGRKIESIKKENL